MPIPIDRLAELLVALEALVAAILAVVRDVMAIVSAPA
jgi:hypothetical protein